MVLPRQPPAPRVCLAPQSEFKQNHNFSIYCTCCHVFPLMLIEPIPFLLCLQQQSWMINWDLQNVIVSTGETMDENLNFRWNRSNVPRSHCHPYPPFLGNCHAWSRSPDEHDPPKTKRKRKALHDQQSPRKHTSQMVNPPQSSEIPM